MAIKYLICLLIIFSFRCNAQDITWDETNDFLSIGDQIGLLEDESGQLTFKDVSSKAFEEQFKPSDSKILSLGYTDSYFWLRMTIHNQTNENAILELAQAGIPSADFYYHEDSIRVHHIAAGYNIPVENKLVKSSYQVYHIRPGLNTYYIRLNTNSEPIPIHLYKQKSYELATDKQKIVYGIYLGLMIFVVLNTFFLFVSLRKRLYLFYALIVILYTGYAAIVIDGFIVYFIPYVNLKFLYTTIPAFGITLQTIYCLVFLEARKYSPKVFKVVTGIIIYFAAWMIVKFFFPFSVVQPINTVNALISFLLMGIVGVKVGTEGNRMGYYFALAYFFYFILVAVQAIYINTGTPRYIGGLSYVAYATLIEAFLLSFLLSRRFEWEKEDIEHEKLAAQMKVVEKTLENKRIIEGQKNKLEQEVTSRTIELQKTNQQLTETNEKLLDLNREKDGLINIVAHDLKSPLCSIIGFTELIKREGKLNQKQDEYLSIIDSVSQNGLYLIDDLLDVHSFEFGYSKVNHQKIHLSQFINDWLKTFHQQIANKKQKVHFEDNMTNQSYSTDPFMLSRILNNILSNAIKFSDKGKTIHVKAHDTPTSIHISIRDEGPGISQDDQKLMFKRFQKLSARPTDGESSNGLGLSIVQALVEKLNGEISVKSQVGAGTEFNISLPLNQLPEDIKKES